MGRKIRQAAELQDCTLRLDGCNYWPETTVFAHLPSRDKGMGIKSPDFWGVFACSNCHDALDGRRQTAMARYLIDQSIIRALFETQKILMEKGLMSYDDG